MLYCRGCGTFDPPDVVDQYSGHVYIDSDHHPDCDGYCTQCPIAVQRLCGPVVEQPDYLRDYPADELYSAAPDCDHYVLPASGGGVKCVRCPGWFCY